MDYVNLILCRDIFHCRPSELRQEKIQDVQAALTCMDVEAKVKKAKSEPGLQRPVG